MKVPKTQLILIILLIILIVGGLVATFILNNNNQPNTLRSEASEGTPVISIAQPKLPGGMPLKGDFNGDGAVDQNDESLFMLKYQAKDPSADLDGSGQVNSLDITTFKMLISK